MTEKYPVEVLGSEEDDGTMPSNVQLLADSVIGDRIARAEQKGGNMVLTLGSGRQVTLKDSDDCCAFTSLDKFLLHPERVHHMIMGVGTTSGFQKWHIYADLGDVLELDVDWSAGNIGYYGYGFDIVVDDSDMLPPVGDDEMAEILASIKKAADGLD